jgi:hypothetical protein
MDGGCLISKCSKEKRINRASDTKSTKTKQKSRKNQEKGVK